MGFIVEFYAGKNHYFQNLTALFTLYSNENFIQLYLYLLAIFNFYVIRLAQSLGNRFMLHIYNSLKKKLKQDLNISNEEISLSVSVYILVCSLNYG